MVSGLGFGVLHVYIYIHRLMGPHSMAAHSSRALPLDSKQANPNA